MFGGLAFLLAGNMAVGIADTGELIVRVAPQEAGDALAEPHTVADSEDVLDDLEPLDGDPDPRGLAGPGAAQPGADRVAADMLAAAERFHVDRVLREQRDELVLALRAALHGAEVAL